MRDAQRDRTNVWAQQSWREHAIVGAKQDPAVRHNRQRGPRRADARVDHRQMQRSHGKAVPVTGNRQSCQLDILGGNVVRQVHHCRIGKLRIQHALHFGYVSVGGAVIREQGDDWAHTYTDLRCQRPPRQRSIIARPRAAAVNAIVHQMPVVPQRPAAHAAAGIRSAVRVVEVSIGGRV